MGNRPFLVCYLVYHVQVGSVRFQGTGAVRTVYLTILATHTVLAAVPVVAIVTLRRALAARFDKHSRIARWTLPIWLYVSVQGWWCTRCCTGCDSVGRANEPRH